MAVSFPGHLGAGHVPSVFRLTSLAVFLGEVDGGIHNLPVVVAEKSTVAFNYHAVVYAVGADALVAEIDQSGVDRRIKPADPEFIGFST